MLPFLKDKNKEAAISIIVGKLNKQKMGSEKDSNAHTVESNNEEDNSVAYKSAAEELISALKSENTDGVVRALKAFFDVCSSEEEDSEEPADEEEDSSSKLPWEK